MCWRSWATCSSARTCRATSCDQGAFPTRLGRPAGAWRGPAPPVQPVAACRTPVTLACCSADRRQAGQVATRGEQMPRWRARSAAERKRRHGGLLDRSIASFAHVLPEPLITHAAGLGKSQGNDCRLAGLTMQRARGLIALLEAARQCSWAGLTAASFPPCQALGTHSPGVLAAPASLRSLWSAAGGPPAPPIDHWRRLHSAAATAAAAAACGGGGSAAAAGSGAAAAAAAVTSAAEQKQVLYRGKGMRLFRVLVRCGRAGLAGGHIRCNYRCRRPAALQPSLPALLPCLPPHTPCCPTGSRCSSWAASRRWLCPSIRFWPQARWRARRR